MNTAIIKPQEIKPAEYNPRKQLKPGDAEYEALKNSLERFGMAEPLIVNRKTGKLISGHQRLNILMATGVEETEIILVDFDEQQEKLLNIALNKIDGDWDYQKLEALFEDITADGIDDIQFTGFTEAELDNLFDDMESPVGDDGGSESDATDSMQQDKTVDGDIYPAHTFDIFLSFARKELAEKWLKDRGIELAYEGYSRNITIKMEGIGYDKRN